MTIVVTGAAGFIGFYVCKALLDRNENVIGIDNMNDYYDVNLKKDRLSFLKNRKNFKFKKTSITNEKSLAKVMTNDVTSVIHLAAQAGIRYSLENPRAYMESNIMGHFTILEAIKDLPNFEHLVYASSSSVYGNNFLMPFFESDRVDNPVSLYAATKRSNELISHTYSHLYNIPQTGLRFFTVYGPWGRPDMAYFSFTKSIIEGKPIKVFNNGNMNRDFTYIDDIVDGVISALDKPPTKNLNRFYNLGNNRSETLLHFIEVIEEAVGKKAILDLQPMQPGDIQSTYADISKSQKDLGFSPRISIEKGIPHFVQWYKDYYQET